MSQLPSSTPTVMSNSGVLCEDHDGCKKIFPYPSVVEMDECIEDIQSAILLVKQYRSYCEFHNMLKYLSKAHSLASDFRMFLSTKSSLS